MRQAISLLAAVIAVLCVGVPVHAQESNVRAEVAQAQTRAGRWMRGWSLSTSIATMTTPS